MRAASRMSRSSGCAGVVAQHFPERAIRELICCPHFARASGPTLNSALGNGWSGQRYAASKCCNAPEAHAPPARIIHGGAKNGDLRLRDGAD